MSQISPRKRLCQVILGGELKAGQANGVSVSIPVLCEDIDERVLFAAHEAIFSYTPAHVRQVLPFVLPAIEEQGFGAEESGFIDAFLMHVNYAFFEDGQTGAVVDAISAQRELPLRYRSEYRENWTAETLTALSRFERGWAYEWVCALLDSDVADGSLFLRQDLTMLARLLGLALGKDVSEAPEI